MIITYLPPNEQVEIDQNFKNKNHNEKLIIDITQWYSISINQSIDQSNLIIGQQLIEWIEL
ncbi:hypothetical protein DERP_004027 [Dermatophagoides pteronyssinus]|uniref:Uncharacterized protein n=1 Tax=Dermatophagoides pteronyssinus TaxID=6956 RepID=A0ABQ8J7Z5_DERPT|nr:hypothetical protein DERP_004027 [Dermatophagoides pteronyssinus]